MLPFKSEDLPDFVSAATLRRQAVRAIAPPSKILVSEAAEKHRRLKNPRGYSGPWRNETTPYLVEPMDRALDRDVELLNVVAPSQVGKSEIFLNIVGHAALYQPADILLIQPTRELALDFAERRVDRFLATSPAIGAELGRTRSDDKALAKTFKSGMILSVGWPTGGQLASRPVALGMLDERDRMPDDIDGEGDPVQLLRNRVKTFGRAGKVIVAGSPSRIDGTGSIALCADGELFLWFWPCDHCGEFFSPGFDAERKPTLDHLIVGDPEDPRETAALACPHCGGIHEESDKPRLNDAGRWIGRGQSIDAAGNVAGERARSRTVSYWISGFASPFVTWGQIAEKWISAERHFERTADENALKTFYNTDLGFPYRPRHLGEPAVEAHELAERREDWPAGQVPEGVRFLVASVDVQADRFEVQISGFSEDAETWVIDRFAIRQLDDGKTDIRPAQYPEHWRELLGRVIWAQYPLASDPAKGLPIATTAIDTGGIDGVTANAKAFWTFARRAGVSDAQLMLVKGAAQKTAAMLSRPSFDSDARGRQIRNGPKVFLLGVHQLKDTIDNCLRRAEPGPGFIHWPADIDDRYLEEATAEVKEGNAWVKKGPNETFDLLVYARAAWLRVRPWRINWQSPPKIGQAVAMTAAGEGEAAGPAPAEEPAAAVADPVDPDEAPTRRRKLARRRRAQSYVQAWR